ncbi:MAG: ABC transporter substrate-binding protein [Halanaerobiales bacterium]
MKKKFMLIIGIVFLLSFLGTSGVLAQEGDSNISFTWWGDTDRHEIYNSIADMFEEEHPDIKVDTQSGSWNQYWDKLATQMAGGNAPDVVGMHQRFVSDYAPRGALLDLQEYVDSGVLDLSDVPDSVKEGGVVDGKLSMVAQGVTTTGYMFNTKTFDEIDVEYPDMDWTYEEFAEKAREVRAAAEEEGLDMWGAGDDSTLFMPHFAYFARSKGETVYTDEGELGFSEETVEEWFEYWKELRDDDIIPDMSTTAEYASAPLEQNLFTTEQTAIATVPANQLWLYQEQFEDDGQINIVRTPHFADGEPGEYIEGSYLAVSSSSDNPEAAAKLIDFFINDEEVQRLFMLEQGVPPTTTAQERISDKLTPVQERTIDFVSDTLEIAEKAAYPPSGSSEITAEFEEIAQAVGFDQLTPAQGAEEFMNSAEDILNR